LIPLCQSPRSGRQIAQGQHLGHGTMAIPATATTGQQHLGKKNKTLITNQ